MSFLIPPRALSAFLALLVSAPSPCTHAAPPDVPPPATREYRDPDYGSRILHLRNDAGHEHNLYYYRDCWNADTTLMVAIHSDLQQSNWRVALYDADANFLRDLFTIEQFDWRICWDRNDPNLLYTTRGPELHAFNVSNGRSRLLKSFHPKNLKPTGPSLNQTGDRILIVTADGTFRSFRLSDMDQERTFKPTVPDGCEINWDKVRYLGHRDFIDIAYRSPDGTRQAIAVHDDSGKLLHQFDGIGGGGHYTYSPTGKLAYFKLPQAPRNAPRGTPRTPLEIHVVNLDGSDDRILFSAPAEQLTFVQNLHLAWPAKVDDWFVASFFPSANRLPPRYAPLLDEIVLIRLDGTHQFLARTHTAHSRDPAKGRAGDLFWAQPLTSPSADGSRILFNSLQAGTIDLYVLHTPRNLDTPRK